MATIYLTNKALLQGIHKSKLTFCYVQEDKYRDYHRIVGDKMLICDELIESILSERRARKGKKAVPEIAPDEVCIRVMTYEHVPLDGTRKRKNANIAEPFAKTNFPPFKHYILREGKLVEVVRSHWKGDLKTGCFCIDHGRIGEDLAQMYMLLVRKIALKSNFHGYSFRDEMESHAIMQLIQNGLQFSEFKQEKPNPFAWNTQCTINAFKRVLNLEKKNRDIRDDVLQEQGARPSMTRQMLD